jgi:hypothetical protein
MNRKLYTSSLTLFVLLVFVSGVRADTYSRYQTTLYFSANKQYFVEVSEKKRATLYVNGQRVKRIWTRVLTELPGEVIVSNDGSRVAVIDRYYGNGGNPEAAVVIILNEKGDALASHPLKEVANLERVLQTTSTAHWYWAAGFTADGQSLIIETFSRKCGGQHQSKSQSEADAAIDCDRATPYERLRFSAATGQIVERSLLATAMLR